MSAARPDSNYDDLLRLFWRRTRQAFVPLTADEAAARLGDGRSTMQVGTSLAAARRLGLVASVRAPGNGAMLWSLTDKGEARVRRLVGVAA